MANGQYIALSAAVATSKQLAVVANNLANVNTTGFKQSRTAFEDYLKKSLNGETPTKGQVVLAETRVDLSHGPVEATGNSLDVALQSEGFMLVQSEQGEHLTRAGALTVSSDGYLVDLRGNRVMSGTWPNLAPIRVPADNRPIQINASGEVERDGTVIAKITVVTTDPKTLTPTGNGLFRAPQETLTQVNQPSFLSGYLEKSNVNAIRGMIDLIELNRQYTNSYKLMDKYSKLDSKTMSIV